MAAESAQITKMSSKGQVVIPEEIRDGLNLEAGSTFVVFGRKDSILLKKLEFPSSEKAFEEIASWGRNHAKKEGLDTSIPTILEKQHKLRK